MIEALLPLLLPVLAAALVAQASPGPATLAIARESMAHGRRAGVALALGVSTGSWAWSAVAAGGMSALILASEWAVIGLRVAAALYLGWLAWKSARSALRPAASGGLGRPPAAGSSYARGLLIHLTNPKAILFFGALYAYGASVLPRLDRGRLCAPAPDVRGRVRIRFRLRRDRLPPRGGAAPPRVPAEGARLISLGNA
jgi:threonine/homoserine/homoserine lactone efflux protein